jgi:hypothetical protein
MAGIRRDKLDAIFSALIRERANQLCESTGRCGSEVQLECCHIVGRRNKAVRWHPLNALSLCHSQHRYFTENPLAYSIFVERKIGKTGVAELNNLACQASHWTPRQLEGLYKHYCNEYARLVNARENGRLGRIEFVWPDPMPEATPRAKAKKAKAKSKFKRKVNGKTVRRDAA